jgi:hypothetical protein
VKTRLCPPFHPAQAAALAEASLIDTLAAARASQARRTTLALDGPRGSWCSHDVNVVPQRPGGLDRRIAGALQDAWRDCQLPLLLVGMDTPQITAEVLDASATRLLANGTDAVLGLARDGGWWALGLCRPDDALLLGIEMSTSSTGTAQLTRLRQAGLTVGRLMTLIDVDVAQDAYDVASSAPATRFAAALALVGAA